MDIGTLASIWRYPVKSLAAEALESTAVGVEGLENDRTSAFFVRDGHARVGKTYRGKEHDKLHLIHDVDEAAERARAKGVTVELTAGEHRHFDDDAPVSIVVDRWLDGVSEYVGYRVEPERFRPNFFVRADAAFSLAEPDLTGRELSLGEIALRVRYPIARCVVTTYDPQGGESDPRVLRYIAHARSTWMGIYCDVLREGTVRVGDSLQLM